MKNKTIYSNEFLSISIYLNINEKVQENKHFENQLKTQTTKYIVKKDS